MLIYLCEDDQADQVRAKHFLGLYAKKMSCSFRVTAFSDARQMLSTFEKSIEQPALVLMDILMDNLNGMDAARRMREAGYKNRIVFISSSPEHALESFQVYADGFILKPYTFEEFVFTLDRLSHLFRRSSQQVEVKEVGGEVRKLFPETIRYIEIENRNLRFHTTKSSFLAVGKISDYAELLQNNFLRIGHSFLVNAGHIKEITEGTCVLESGEEISVPVRRRASVERKYRAYWEQNGGSV